MGSKYRLVAASALAAAAAVFGACRANDTAGNSRAAAQPDAGAAHAAAKAEQQQLAHADEARRVTVDELRKMLASGEAAVYDTRPREAYEQEHIKGALSMPSGEVDARSGELPSGKTLVFYCT
jgi:Rhodanese-like domain